MPIVRVVCTGLLICACGSPMSDRAVRDSGSNAFDVISHDENAVRKAPQWTIDPAPLVVYESGENAEFDISDAAHPTRLADGRLVVLNRYTQSLLLFDAAGRPERVLARQGEGPGQLMNANDVIRLGGDTLAIGAQYNGQLNFYSPSAGFLGSLRLADWKGARCLQLLGTLPDDRLLTAATCSRGPPRPSTAGRVPFVVMTVDRDASRPDTIATIPGYELAPHTVQGRATTVDLEFGRRPLVALWDTLVVTATGEGGYVIDLRTPDGTMVRSIRLEIPRRPVTREMRDSVVNANLAVNGYNGETPVYPTDRAEVFRSFREWPFADSLPPYRRLVVVPRGWLWVVDYRMAQDPQLSATAFGPDGSLKARLYSTHSGTPVWFDSEQVLLRETDDNDVLRFALYRMRPIP